MLPMTQAESNIQLNVRLEKLCRIERKIFCADVDSDNSGAVIECLQENRKQSRMSTKCKAAIRKNMEIQSRNVMLNRSLLKACFGTFHKICNAPAGKLTDEESAKLITCMLNKRQQVVSQLYTYIDDHKTQHRTHIHSFEGAGQNLQDAPR